MELALDSGGATQARDEVFDRPWNESLVHQVAVAYMAGGRALTRAQKTRAQVRASGKKPWRQKGTGRARAGTVASPLWRGGGVAHAASPGGRVPKVNRAMLRGAMCSALSELLRRKCVTVTADLNLETHKTGALAAWLRERSLDSALILVDEENANLTLASRNLPRVEVKQAERLNVVDLLKCEKLLLTDGAVRKLEAWLA